MNLPPWCSPMLRRISTIFVGLAFTLCLVSAQGQDDAVDTRRLTELLELREGSTVADIGAGSGPLTTRIAQLVGPTGRVFATDVNPKRLEEIREAVAKAGLTNVTVVDGGSDDTRLPNDCCAAIFMRLVYHHFGDPPRMNASLLRSVRRGGRVVVVDFPPKSGETAPPGKRGEGDAHGVTAA